MFVCVSVCLTQAAELTDDGRQRVVHHTLQLAADALGEFPSAEVTGLDVPLHQRHGEASHRHKLQGNKGNKHTVLDTDMILIQQTSGWPTVSDLPAMEIYHCTLYLLYSWEMHISIYNRDFDKSLGLCDFKDHNITI